MKPNKLPRPTSVADNQDQKLEEYWSTLRGTDYTDSFARTAGWVRRQQYTTTKSIPALDNLLAFMLGTKLRIACTILGLFFLVAACNYPVEVDQPLATVLQWEVKAGDKAAVEALSRISWLQQGQVMVEEKNINGQTSLLYSFTVPSSDPKNVQTYRSSLAGITGVTGLTVVPVTHKRSQPLYAAALENLFKIEMDATGISDEDLQRELQKQLQEKGLNHIAIEVKTDEAGRRRIATKLAKNPGEDYGLDLVVKDGRQVTHIQEQIKHRKDGSMPDIKAMTDEEIKAFVIKNHPRLQLSGDDITINRQADKIEVTVNDGKGNKLKLLFK